MSSFDRCDLCDNEEVMNDEYKNIFSRMAGNIPNKRADCDIVDMRYHQFRGWSVPVVYLVVVF